MKGLWEWRERWKTWLLPQPVAAPNGFSAHHHRHLHLLHHPLFQISPFYLPSAADYHILFPHPVVYSQQWPHPETILTQSPAKKKKRTNRMLMVKRKKKWSCPGLRRRLWTLWSSLGLWHRPFLAREWVAAPSHGFSLFPWPMLVSPSLSLLSELFKNSTPQSRNAVNWYLFLLICFVYFVGFLIFEDINSNDVIFCKKFYGVLLLRWE